MKPLHVVVLSCFLPMAALAQDATEPADQGAAAEEETVEEPAYGPVEASGIVLSDLLFVSRPVVVFADSPNDPNFIRQMELIGRGLADLEARDVVIITDTDPAGRSELRQKLRPRGFSLVLMDKDLRPVIRKPLPWDVREITHAIDKFPLRRQEIMQGAAAGG